MRSRVLRSVLAVCLFGCALAGDALAATGDLTQKAGTAGCISETGSGGACADGTSLSGTFGVTVSPDGKNAYVAGGSPGGVAVFDRASDGTLTQKAGTAGCISESGNGGACADGRALQIAVSVTVSPDGTSVYVASVSTGVVAVFARAGDGTLTQKAGTAGCISDNGSGGACADGTALVGGISVTVSPDGQSAYVAAFNSDAVAVFDRASDGTLTQKPGIAGCISDNGSGGACAATGSELGGANSVAVSPDGQSAYVGSSSPGAVAVFDRALAGTTPPTSGGQVVSNPPPDGDGDGVPNATDGCPLTAGPSNNSGCPANAFAFAGKPLRRNGYTILKVKVPGPGRINAAQAKVTKKKPALIKAVAVSTKRAGQVTLKFKPTNAGKKVLAKRGKFTVNTKITYTPTGGRRSSRNQPVVLASRKLR